jgi:5'-3' exonuclease
MNKRPPRDGSVKIKTKNTLLIDGGALFKTGYHGAKSMYNSEGKPIGGVYQFLTILRKMLTEDLYHRVYVFWDGNFSGKLRYDIYKPYKSGRGKNYETGTQPTDEDELLQRRRVWDYLNEMHIRQLKHEVIEGDDFIAYYCLKKQPNEKITIVTNDRDMAQLIDKDVKIYFCDKSIKNYVDNTNFLSYFCYSYENGALVKTMIGDNSDTISGIKGLKEKTLINLFPMLSERKLTLNEIIDEAKRQQLERTENKKKPLKILDNIVNCVTEGVQGKKLYEINHKLVNLKEPMMTQDGVEQLEELIVGFIDEFEFKEVYDMMVKDGLDKEMGEYRYQDFLVPFKSLLKREITSPKNN